MPLFLSIFYFKGGDLMSSGFSKQFQRMNQWTNLVKSRKEITKWDLMMEMRLTIAQYNQHKPFQEAMQGHLIEYDKTKQSWIYVGKLETQELQEKISN